jgi:Tfp pilus assembly protein PilF
VRPLLSIIVLLSVSLLHAQEGPACSPPLYHLYRGDADRTIAELRKAPSGVASADENVRGVALLMKNDLPPAVAAFRRALAADASFAHARFNLGVALIRLKDYGAARRELTSVASASPELANLAALHLGLLELRSGDAAAAAPWLDQVVAAEPDNADAHFHRGVAHESAGDLQAAGRSYRQFLQLRPDSAAGHLRFGVSALRAGKAETAKRYLRHAIELAPGSPEAAEAQKFLVIWD